MGSGCAGKSYALTASDLESSASARLEHSKTGASEDRPASAPAKEKSIPRLYQGTYWDCRECGAQLHDTSQPLCAACYKEEPGHAPTFIPRSPDKCTAESVSDHPSSPSFSGRPTIGSKGTPGRSLSKGDAIARSESKRTQEGVPTRTSSKHIQNRAQTSSKELTDRPRSKEPTDRPRSKEPTDRRQSGSKEAPDRRQSGSKEAPDRRQSSSKELAVRTASKRSAASATASVYSSMDSNLKDEALKRNSQRAHPFAPDESPLSNTSGPTSPEAARRASQERHGSKDHHGHHHHHHHDKRRHKLSESDASEMLSTLVDSDGQTLNFGDRVIGEGRIGEEMGLGSITGAGDSHGHGMVIVKFDWGGREHPMKAEHLTRLDGKHEAEIRRRLEKQHKDAKH